MAQRMDRQAVLQDGPVRLAVVLDEAALYRMVGDEDVMREQLQHLLSMMPRRRVTIQIMPLGMGSYSATGPMAILDVDGSPVDHLEVPAGPSRTTSDLGID